jgi:hypothetical protein
MNSFAQKSMIGGSGSSPAEETLRLIARLPVPDGLEERIHIGLKAQSAAASSRGRLLRWLLSLRPDMGWAQSAFVRSAAAAAIVAAVVGGGWGVYSHIHVAEPARAVTTAPSISAPRGFSSAGAMRTPQTLNGPVVAPTAASTAKPAATPAHRGKTAKTKATQTTVQKAEIRP